MTPHRGVADTSGGPGGPSPGSKAPQAGRPEAVWSGSETEGETRTDPQDPQPAGLREGETQRVRQETTRQSQRAVVTSYHIRKSPQLQALFHSLCRVLCTIRSLYFCTIGSASHIQAGQASSCRFHAALSSNTTQRSGADVGCGSPISDQQTDTGLSPCNASHTSKPRLWERSPTHRLLRRPMRQHATTLAESPAKLQMVPGRPRWGRVGRPDQDHHGCFRFLCRMICLS